MDTDEVNFEGNPAGTKLHSKLIAQGGFSGYHSARYGEFDTSGSGDAWRSGAIPAAGRGATTPSRVAGQAGCRQCAYGRGKKRGGRTGGGGGFVVAAPTARGGNQGQPGLIGTCSITITGIPALRALFQQFLYLGFLRRDVGEPPSYISQFIDKEISRPTGD